MHRESHKQREESYRKVVVLVERLLRIICITKYIVSLFLVLHLMSIFVDTIIPNIPWKKNESYSIQRPI